MGVQEELTVQVLLQFVECLDNGLLLIGVVELLFQFALEEGQLLGGEIAVHGDSDEAGDDFLEELGMSLEGEDDALERRRDSDLVDVIESDGL